MKFNISECLKYWITIYHEDWLHSQSLKSYTDQLEYWLGQEISYQMKRYEEEKRSTSNEKKRGKSSWRKASY